ncbi:MAG: DUF1653 domain-containing protein [Firmicutes bacterium]|nr:DUF1653 domain-containing protein [Bacillota bacterium]
MRTLQIGRVYRHFKNKYYLVVGEALHSETDEKFVVYKQLYGEGLVYIRPYDMFLSEVDHEKYPEVRQKYRFECVNGPEDDSGIAALEDSDDPELRDDPEDESFDRYYEEGGWRTDRDDAAEYGLNPEDFDTEEELEEAIQQKIAGAFQGY